MSKWPCEIAVDEMLEKFKQGGETGLAMFGKACRHVIQKSDKMILSTGGDASDSEVAETIDEAEEWVDRAIEVVSQVEAILLDRANEIQVCKKGVTK